MNNIEKIIYRPGKESIIVTSNGNKNSCCISCKNKTCIGHQRLQSKKFVQFPIDINTDICPVNAIIEENEKIKIKDNCIGCGLCASSCKTGAIYIKDGKAHVNDLSSDFLELNLKENDFSDISKEGTIIEENPQIMRNLYLNIKKNNINPNYLAKILLLQCGINVFLRRKGDVNLRMDGVFELNEDSGILEIEFGNDVLSCPRFILDDIAVLCSRYGFEVEKLMPLVVSLSLPNNRTDFWRVIKDIDNVLNIKIRTITIGALFLLMWNNKKIELLNNKYYYDCDNNSLKECMEQILDRKVNIGNDENSVLETKK